MKKIVAIVLISFVSRAFSQEPFGDKKYFIKTNLFHTTIAQQYALTIENKLDNPFKSNSYTFGFYRNNNGIDCRKNINLTFRRVFYSKPVFKSGYLFFSPYAKLLYRDVKTFNSGGWISFTKDLDFNAIALSLGQDVGFHWKFKNNITIGSLLGFGVGYNIDTQIRKYEKPTDLFLDGQIWIQAGYFF